MASTATLFDADRIVDVASLMMEQPLADYMQFADENSEEILEKMVYTCLRLIKAIFDIEDVKCRRQEYQKYRTDFTTVSLLVTGKLYTQLRDIEYQLSDVDPAQAPKGWKCSICMTSKDSHLCEKTLCNHYFHIGCARNFNSPSCPLCRGFM